MTLSPSAEELFRLNLQQVAKKFGLIDDDIPSLPIADAVKVLNSAEDLSFSPSDEDRLMSLVLCALVWENRQDDWHAIKPFIGRILIRLGLGTSAKMVNWNSEYNLFESLGSVIDDLTSTTKLIEHEITIRDCKIILSDFQKRMWDAIAQYTRVGVSAPTSAGKSYVLLNKAIETLASSNGKVIFIVPTISLITQVSNDLRKRIKEYKLTDIDVSQTVNDVSLFKSDKIIYVLTQERASSALNHPDADFSNIKLLIIDEIQNIEKVANENEERAKILLDVIQTFKNDLNPEKIIIAGPRVENISELVKKWFGDDARSVSDILPAVLNVTFTFKPSRGKLEFQQLIIPGVKHSIVIDDKYQLKKKVFSYVKYDNDFANQFIASVIDRNKSDGNIVFSDSTSNANSIALSIASKLSTENRFEGMDSIKSFVENSVHPKYSLVQALDKGVAYHHSKMPAHIRTLVEKLFGQRHLNTIVSTTTLMQGINLPAKNIIIRNPKVGDDALTGYEFSNLKGRAGRLMKDFVGRALIIDEQKCTDAEIRLEVTDQRSITMGYNSRFESEKIQILDILTNNRQPRDEDNHDIVTYIRNMCLKYGVNGLHRLHEVGIPISQELFQATLTNVQSLPIPKSICLNNFYWDPYLLNSIFTTFQNDQWPKFPSTIVGAANALQQIAIRLFHLAPYYYNRYVGIDPTTEYGGPKLLSLCIFAMNFGMGKPLKDVIETEKFPIKESDDIDNRIADLQTKVVYGIPKLLKPVFHINDLINEERCSHILSFIEVGAFEPKLRSLIEIGVPRETAIAMLEHVRNIDFLDENGKISERMLARFIGAARSNPQISEWHKLLIEDL
ncbi:MAG: DEAD/DEAH box helicase [Chitinophagaceae bacterium]|nr:DEAD/DEAH box helicase [Chitinophagaceae bacterium]